jgi:hypothetical protein
MQILTKKKLRFRGGEDRVFVSLGGNNIESAPEWIEKDPLFPLVVKDGSLVKLAEAPIVQGSSAAAAPKKTAAKKK